MTFFRRLARGEGFARRPNAARYGVESSVNETMSRLGEFVSSPHTTIIHNTSGFALLADILPIYEFHAAPALASKTTYPFQRIPLAHLPPIVLSKDEGQHTLFRHLTNIIRVPSRIEFIVPTTP